MSDVQALPAIRFTWLSLGGEAGNDLTAAGVTSLQPALRRPWGPVGLRYLVINGNPLGCAGVAALAAVLPRSLHELYLMEVDCGDDGFVALAAALPALTALKELGCGENPAGPRGWAALAGALPSLPALQELWAQESPQLGAEGAAALVEAVPRCPQLRTFVVFGCSLETETVVSLRMLAREGLVVSA